MSSVIFPVCSRLIYSVYLLLLLFMPPVLADAPGLLLAKVYSDQEDLAQWWVSEKLDGVRAYWDGHQLISRQGNRFAAPAWFTAGFPDTPLDGELWMGRGTFDELSGTVRQQMPDDAQWRKVRYMVFDMPVPDLTFDERLARLTQLITEQGIDQLQLVKQYKVNNEQALMDDLEQVVARGGEGLMLHRGTSLYRAARSDDLLKLKTYEDAEAVVIAHMPGKGKYLGMMGALLVEMPDQRRFKIGTGFSDAQRADPPPIGSTITYKYFGKTSTQLPRFASFLRVRDEL
ncbi:DNA ligase [Cellvibrio sp. ARAG 10.3]|uniref:DNA ligase n=1 Tax=Cellvibrio sp. ARAG 10.3 TaxID=3451358 RepID=UPI003F477123